MTMINVKDDKKKYDTYVNVTANAEIIYLNEIQLNIKLHFQAYVRA